MKAAELRDLDADALRAKETELDDQLFRMRIQKSMGQLEAPGKAKDVRRDLARIKTILGEKSGVPAGTPANPRAAGKAK